jgi:hypothetical protein
MYDRTEIGAARQLAGGGKLNQSFEDTQDAQQAQRQAEGSAKKPPPKPAPPARPKN